MSHNSSHFAGQTVVITGAASGMGRALAVELAALRADLALCDIDSDGLQSTAQSCRATARRISATVVDVADPAAMMHFAANTVAAFGIPFAVFNNAGQTAVIDVLSEQHEDGKRVFDVNFGGVLHGTKAFLPHLLQADRGHIVNTSSAFGLVAAPTQSSYTASKFAVRGFTESLQRELRASGSGVRAHCVYPGAVRTAIARNAAYADPDVQRWTSRIFDHVLPASSAQGAAQAILAGVADERARIVIGIDGRIIDLTWRIGGGAYQHLTGWALRPLLRRIVH